MSEIKTIENDLFAIEATEESGCTFSLKVFIKPNETQKIHKQAVKKVNKQISIPGFRKGRAPDETVLSRYGSYVEQEWKDLLLNKAYQAALDLSQVYPLNKESVKSIKIESCGLEEGTTVSLSYEHYPNVPTVEFSDITLPEIEKKPVSEEHVNEKIQEVCRSFAEFEPSSKEVVEKGDYISLSIFSLEEDPPKPIVENHLFHVEDEMVEFLKNEVIGMKVGERVETVIPENKQKVSITVEAINTMVIPEPTDELAKKAGASSKEKLLEIIRANLEEEAIQEQHTKRLKALEEALLKQYDFDLPASIVEQEKMQRMKNKEQKELPEEEVAKEVNKDLRLYFLNRQIIKQGNISISKEELSDQITLYNKIASNTKGEISREMISRIASRLIESKAKEYALSQVMHGAQ
ncbi:MAG: trigger factor [Chlamydiales bacterium]